MPTDEGKLYLATVEDLASKRIVGFGLSEHHDAELATGALKMAVTVRGGDVAGTIFHSDRGSEYTAELFESACSTLAVTQSMGRAGSCFDNAAAESWFSTLEWELFRKRRFETKQDARREVAWFIDWYNRVRRHSSCEMKPPLSSRRSSPPGRPKRSQPRRRRETRAPRSPHRLATSSSGTRHRPGDRLKQLSAALHDSGGGPPAHCRATGPLGWHRKRVEECVVHGRMYRHRDCNSGVTRNCSDECSGVARKIRGGGRNGLPVSLTCARCGAPSPATGHSLSTARGVPGRRSPCPPATPARRLSDDHSGEPPHPGQWDQS